MAKGLVDKRTVPGENAGGSRTLLRFHYILDLPSILSGERVGMIDPHHKYFPQSTYGWNLRRTPHILDDLSDQFEPFLNVFGVTKEMLARGRYNNTLFRYCTLEDIVSYYIFRIQLLSGLLFRVM